MTIVHVTQKLAFAEGRGVGGGVIESALVGVRSSIPWAVHIFFFRDCG